MRSVRRALLLLSFPALLAVIGCQNQPDIEVHDNLARLPMQRLLAAIVLPGEHSQQVWVFRMVGPEFAVARAKPDFQQFLRGLRFKNRAPDWATTQLPEGWLLDAADKKKGVRIHFAARDGDKTKLEVAVSKSPLPPKASNEEFQEFLYDNMSSWRKELGLRGEIGSDYLCFYEKQRIGDLSMYIVETTGPGRQDEDETPDTFTYDLPEGWEKGRATRFSLVSLLVRKDDAKAQFTLSQAGGDLFTNINRWRVDQLGLKKLEPDELKKDIQELKIFGLKGHYVDLTGKDMGKGGDRLLGVIVPAEGRQAWVFKFIGPKDLVGAEKANFEKLVQSFELKGK